MRNATILLGALVVTTLLATRANAQDCASTRTFSPSNINFAQTWDPMISPAAKTATFTASFSNFAPASQKVRLIFVDNDAGSPIRLGSSGPRYSVTATSSGATYAFPSGSLVASQPLIDIPGGGNPNVSIGFTVTIPANSSPVEDYVGGLVFSEALKFTLRCEKNNGDITGTNNLQAGPTISLTIPKLVSLTTASPQAINFGNFTTPTQQLNVGLRSTSSVNVSVTTSNNNEMVRAGAVSPYPTNSVIPYTMTLNGDVVANGSSLANRPRAGVTGTTWPLVLTLANGLPSGKLAGGYSDTITLILSPGL